VIPSKSIKGRDAIGDLPDWVLDFGVHDSPEITFHPQLGWKAVASLDSDQRHGLHRVHVRTNSDGFRDEEWAVKLERAEREQATKVLLLGDSYLYGWSILADERLSDQLEERARRAGAPPLVAFNFGIPGYGTGQQLLVLRRWIERIEPDVVVLHFIPNDVANISIPYAYYSPKRRVYRPFFDANGELMLYAEGRRRPSLWLAEKGLGELRLRWLLDIANNRIDDLHYRLRGIADNRVVTDPETGARYDLGQMLFSPHHADLLRASLPKLQALLDELRRVSHQHGANLVIALPFAPPLDTPEQRRLVEILAAAADRRLEMPQELARYEGWMRSLADGHHNYLANLYLARDLLATIDGVRAEADARETEWYHRIPSELDPAETSVSRYVFGDFRRDEQTRQWEARGEGTRILLRAPSPAPLHRLSLRGQWVDGAEKGGAATPRSLEIRVGTTRLALTTRDSRNVSLETDVPDTLLMDGLLLLEIESQETGDAVFELHEAAVLPANDPGRRG
jgi:hypothetical protein